MRARSARGEGGRPPPSPLAFANNFSLSPVLSAPAAQAGTVGAQPVSVV